MEYEMIKVVLQLKKKKKRHNVYDCFENIKFSDSLGRGVIL